MSLYVHIIFEQYLVVMQLQAWRRMMAMIILMINDNDDDLDRLQGWKRMTIAMIILMPINEND